MSKNGLRWKWNSPLRSHILMNFAKFLYFIDINPIVPHLYTLSDHPCQMVKFYLVCGSCSIRKHWFYMKIQKSTQKNAFLVKRSTFHRIENLRQGFFGVLWCILTEKMLRHLTLLCTQTIGSPHSISSVQFTFKFIFGEVVF